MFLFIDHSIFTVLVCDIFIIHMTPLQINNLGGKLPVFATEDSTGMYSSHQSKLVIIYSKKLMRHPSRCVQTCTFLTKFLPCIWIEKDTVLYIILFISYQIIYWYCKAYAVLKVIGWLYLERCLLTFERCKKYASDHLATWYMSLLFTLFPQCYDLFKGACRFASEILIFFFCLSHQSQ